MDVPNPDSRQLNATKTEHLGSWTLPLLSRDRCGRPYGRRQNQRFLRLGGATLDNPLRSHRYGLGSTGLEGIIKARFIQGGRK